MENPYLRTGSIEILDIEQIYRFLDLLSMRMISITHFYVNLVGSPQKLHIAALTNSERNVWSELPHPIAHESILLLWPGVNGL